jgi:hypothetical protein
MIVHAYREIILKIDTNSRRDREKVHRYHFVPDLGQEGVLFFHEDKGVASGSWNPRSFDHHRCVDGEVFDAAQRIVGGERPEGIIYGGQVEVDDGTMRGYDETFQAYLEAERVRDKAAEAKDNAMAELFRIK